MGKIEEANKHSDLYRGGLKPAEPKETRNCRISCVVLGCKLGRAGKIEEENQAYQTAIEDGNSSGTDLGKESAANAGINVV